ncbi:hypothetical protein BKA16_003640 [Gordonia humi]|uniref:Uncharacterized protein n=1 Tax=Gordonia humi TaxID=686429 RepID=A0A840F3Q0_9ACTN|nr:hypothetical protein [Gordonia humi]
MTDESLGSAQDEPGDEDEDEQRDERNGHFGTEHA